MPIALAKKRPEEIRGTNLRERLIKLRARNPGWTQDWMSHEMGIAWVTLNRYLNRHRHPEHLYADAVEAFLKKHGG